MNLYVAVLPPLQIEQLPSGVRNTAYNYRFPVPQKSKDGES